MDGSLFAHVWLMERSLIRIDGRGLGWLDGLFNHVPPARHRPYISLSFLIKGGYDEPYSFHAGHVNQTGLTTSHTLANTYTIINLNIKICHHDKTMI